MTKIKRLLLQSTLISRINRALKANSRIVELEEQVTFLKTQLSEVLGDRKKAIAENELLVKNHKNE